MRNSILFALFSLTALAAFGYDTVELVYRGHLKYTDFSAPRPSSVAMTFRLYAEKSDETPTWTKAVDFVELDKDGFFQVALSGDGLAAAINSGKAGYIGVTIADGKEQYPRQQLLSNASASKAAKAGRLTSSPTIDSAEVNSAEFKSVSVSDIHAAKGINLPTSDQMLTIDVVHNKKDFVLKTKGEVTFFRQGKPTYLGSKTTSNGGVSFSKADYNCVAFFTSVDSTAVPGIVQFIRKGETVMIPNHFSLPDGLTIKCWLYPIGAE